MRAPIQLDFAKSPLNKVWAVNNSPAKLDDMYNRLLGAGGSKMLPEELKWLAVTHKSFDQGRRGFNVRLALMGTWGSGVWLTVFFVLPSPRPHHHHHVGVLLANAARGGAARQAG